MKYSTPTGLFDIVPTPPEEPWRSSHLWAYIEGIMRQTAADFGFREIRTPMFERAELFMRNVGETSDIVAKEMYLFKDKGDRDMALRPEGTAPVMRAFVENQLQNQGQVHKLFYIAPMFRYDRPQAGRYRQHHQFGAEAIGNRSPEQDVECIDLLFTVFNRLGLKNLAVSINSLGDEVCRNAFREALVQFLTPYRNQLSEDSQKRLTSNPLRILDSKDPNDQKILEEAPSILDFLSPDSYNHFQRVQHLLKQIQIPFQIVPRLVRGLDYYNELVFEVTSEELGAQNSLGGGGRYDGLLRSVDGPDLPSCGFGAGIERILHTLIRQNIPLPEALGPKVYLIPLGEAAKKEVFTLCHHLRAHNISTAMEFADRKLNKSMQVADQLKAEFVAVIGDKEVASRELDLKNMVTGQTKKVPFAALLDALTMTSLVPLSRPSLTEADIPFKSPVEKEAFLETLQKSVHDTIQSTEQLHQKVEQMKQYLKDNT